MSTDIFGLLDQVNTMEGGLGLDLIGGPNVRLRAGETTTFGIEDRTGYISLPKTGASLTRLTISDQNGMPVVRGVIALDGERIGLLDGETEVPLPVYSEAAFHTWRTWKHLVNFEFMNPDEAAIANLRDLALAANFVDYVPRQTTAEPYVRKEGVKVTFDKEAPGKNISERFEKGIRLDSIVLVPDIRVEANLTEFTRKETGATERKAAFTSFVDTLVPNMVTALKVHAAKAPTDEQRQAMNRLSVLTGHNPETDWPHRPTLGYITPTGSEEISLFGDRGAKTEEAAVPAASEESAPVDPALAPSDEAFPSA